MENPYALVSSTMLQELFKEMLMLMLFEATPTHETADHLVDIAQALTNGNVSGYRLTWLDKDGNEIAS